VERERERESSKGECVCLERQLSCPPEDSYGLSEKGNMSYWVRGETKGRYQWEETPKTNGRVTIELTSPCLSLPPHH